MSNRPYSAAKASGSPGYLVRIAVKDLPVYEAFRTERVLTR
ncbi:hypothetical protein ACFQ36_10885 [Arthrobacter sp. GCM10027362]